MAKETAMAAADARIDQCHAALRDELRRDVDGWARTVQKIRDPAGYAPFTPDEMVLVLRLANFGSAVVTGRMLGRSV